MDPWVEIVLFYREKGQKKGKVTCHSLYRGPHLTCDASLTCDVNLRLTSHYCACLRFIHLVSFGTDHVRCGVGHN
jgi:hypothetical protein